MVDAIDKVMGNPQLKDHWFRRGVAYIIDSVIIFIVILVLIMIAVVAMIGTMMGGAMTGNPMGGFAGGLIILILMVFIAFFFSIAYWVYFDAKGGTPGKRFMKLRPQAISGEMDFAKALIRNLAKIAGGFIGSWMGNIAGGMLMAIFVEWLIVGLDAYMGISKGEDPRRKLTDFWAGTTVVRTDVAEDFGPIAQPTPPTTTEVPQVSTQPTPTTTTEAPQVSTQPAPVSTAMPQEPTYSADSKVKLDDLRDKFLLGEITEEEYWAKRKQFSDLT